MHLLLEFREGHDFHLKRGIQNGHYEFGKYMIKTFLTAAKVNNSADTSLLKKYRSNPLDVHLEFSKQEANPKLNVTLKSDTFLDIEEKIAKNFAITALIKFGLPNPDGRGQGIEMHIKASSGMKPYKNGLKYAFEDVKYQLFFCNNVLEILNRCPVMNKLTFCYDTNNVKSSPGASCDKFEINRKILNDGIATDVTIVASNGARIKCHKSFLIAHSSMFEAMLQSKMQEARTNIIKMTTVSEPVVRAVLNYLYFWELKEPLNNPEMAVELLKTADCYMITRLGTALSDLLLNKPAEWFSVDGALDLFMFSHRLNRHQLKSAAIQALHIKFDELKTNRSYLELFEKDPKTARELCNAALAVINPVEIPGNRRMASGTIGSVKPLGLGEYVELTYPSSPFCQERTNGRVGRENIGAEATLRFEPYTGIPTPPYQQRMADYGKKCLYLAVGSDSD